MTNNRSIIGLTTVALLFAVPAFAQTTPAQPTGKSDTTSAGAMKSDSGSPNPAMTSGGMTNGNMKTPTANGTSTVAGPAGKTPDPANR